MERRQVSHRRTLTACLVGWSLLGLVPTSAAAQEIERFRISQAHTRLPEVAAYLDVVDAAGSPARTLDEVTATLGDEELAVESLSPFETSGEGVAYLFLVDVSKSLRQAQFDQIRAALERWISELTAADRAAILTFGESCQVAADFTADREALRTVLTGLGPTDQETQLHLAFERALELGRRLDPDLPTRRVIVVLSDGRDEGSGLTTEDVARLIEQQPLPIYAIGYSRLPERERRRHLDVLNRFARLSGGVFFPGDEDSLGEVYDGIRQAVRRVWVARFSCPTCQGDGRIHRFQINVTAGGRVFSEGMSLRLLPGPRPEPELPPVPEPRRWWMLAAAGGSLLLLSAILIWWWLARRRSEAEAAEEEDVVVPELEPGAGEWGAAASEDDAEAPGIGGEDSGLNLQLVVVRGRIPGRAYPVRLVRRCVVGSDGDNDLVLADEDGVEDRHFELTAEGRELWIRDLTRQRTTSVNGVPIAGPFHLEKGDLILAGRTELRIVFS
ncbi:MAG: VWA domain-containing protein [bacterium]|nr:VWA domain-containing protein [bacterium]